MQLLRASPLLALDLDKATTGIASSAILCERDGFERPLSLSTVDSSVTHSIEGVRQSLGSTFGHEHVVGDADPSESRSHLGVRHHDVRMQAEDHPRLQDAVLPGTHGGSSESRPIPCAL